MEDTITKYCAYVQEARIEAGNAALLLNMT